MNDSKVVDKIRARAQEFCNFRMACGIVTILDKSGFRPYTAQDDWLRAEKEIKDEISGKNSKEYNEWLNV